MGCRKCTLSVLFNPRVKSSRQTMTVRSFLLCYITAHLFLSKYYTMPKKLLVIWDEIHFHFTLVLFRLQDDSLISQAPKESLANGFKKKKVWCCREERRYAINFHKKLCNWYYTEVVMFITHFKQPLEFSRTQSHAYNFTKVS